MADKAARTEQDLFYVEKIEHRRTRDHDRLRLVIETAYTPEKAKAFVDFDGTHSEVTFELKPEMQPDLEMQDE